MDYKAILIYICKIGVLVSLEGWNPHRKKGSMMIGFTVDLHPPIFLAIYLIMLILMFLIRRFSKRTYTSKITHVAAFLFYILAVFKLAILPMRILFEGHRVHHPELYFQLIPLKTIITTYHYGNYIQIFGNILLLLPLPIFISLIFKRDISFKQSLIVSICACLSIEIIQYLINVMTRYPNKVADIDDLILNTIGAIIGFYIIKIINTSSIPGIRKIKGLIG